jgi:hypothetical protein
MISHRNRIDSHRIRVVFIGKLFIMNASVASRALLGQFCVSAEPNYEIKISKSRARSIKPMPGGCARCTHDIRRYSSTGKFIAIERGELSRSGEKNRKRRHRCQVTLCTFVRYRMSMDECGFANQLRVGDWRFPFSGGWKSGSSFRRRRGPGRVRGGWRRFGF